MPRELLTFFNRGVAKVSAKGGALEVYRRIAYFPEYSGRSPRSTFNRKPVVGPPHRPFAELQVVERLEQDGWTAGWAYRPGKFTSSWEPLTPVSYPSAALKLLERIRKRSGAKAGCWDVFAWKDGKPRFIELKRRNSSDALQTSQLAWRKAALAEGVDEAAFELIEWCGGSLKGRRLRLTFYFGVDPSGWAEWRKGEVVYGGSSGRGNASVVDFYRNHGTKSEADLLWLVFMRNSSGMTWCDFDEFGDRKPQSRK